MIMSINSWSSAGSRSHSQKIQEMNTFWQQNMYEGKGMYWFLVIVQTGFWCKLVPTMWLVQE